MTKISAFAAAFSLVTGLAGTSYAQGGIPANKTAVVAKNAMVIEQTNDGVQQHVQTLLSETVRTPGNATLLLNVAMECFIGSYDIDSVIPYSPLSAFDFRRATVEVWVEIDGTPLPKGRVSFCDHRVFHLQFDLANVLDVQLERLGGAYAFNWAALNLTNGIHTIEVKGRLRTNVLSIDNILDEGIRAVVGKRSLIVEPAHVRIGETLADDTP